MTDISSVGIRLHQSNSDSKRPTPTVRLIFSFIDVPDSSWAGASNLGMTPTDVHGQFSTHEPLLSMGENTVFLQSIHDKFLRINQEWLLCARTPTEITATPTHHYVVQTQAEKYHTLTTMPLGVGTLIVVQWVENTSDGGNAQLTNPVVLVLSPLLAPPQEGGNVGTTLTKARLNFQKLAKPLGKMWPSKQIYPLVSPLFRDTQVIDSNGLFHAWDIIWTSIYQFDHGL